MKKVLEFRKEIVKKCEDITSPYLEELHCIDVFFECGTGQKYGKIARFAKQKGYTKAFDIGCALGLQSEAFVGTGVEYIGINNTEMNYFNGDIFKYITKEYPFKIKTEKTDIAISFLCLGWNCYLYEKDKTLHEQFNALSNDFNSCILDVPKDKFDIITKYFPNVEHIENNINYFYK